MSVGSDLNVMFVVNIDALATKRLTAVKVWNCRENYFRILKI